MEKSSPFARVLSLALSASLLSGCAVQQNSPAGLMGARPNPYGPAPRGPFYQPGREFNKKIPARVAIVQNPGPKPQVLYYLDQVAGVALDAKEYPAAVQRMLSEIYSSVSISSTAAEAKGADYLVFLSTAYPAVVGLTFSDPKDGRVVASFAEPGLKIVSAQPSGGAAAASAVFIFPLIGAANRSKAEKARQEPVLAEKTAAALARLRERIPKNDAVLRTPGGQTDLEKSEAAGDAALAQGDAARALSSYSRALRQVLAGGETSFKLQHKIARAAARLDERPAPGEEPKTLMARGKALVQRAQTPADYDSAAAEMERALLLAPWWAAGHFNTALAHEGAGNWTASAEHLRLYLALSPGASDADQVKDKIVELQIRQEKGDAPAGAVQ